MKHDEELRFVCSDHFSVQKDYLPTHYLHILDSYKLSKLGGFEIDNSLFARHSWYFRNALVRAIYKNAIKGIDYTSVYLEHFFRNLLLGEKCDLRNRYLHIHATDEWKVQPQLDKTTNTSQAQADPHKYPTSKRQVAYK